MGRVEVGLSFTTLTSHSRPGAGDPAFGAIPRKIVPNDTQCLLVVQCGKEHSSGHRISKLPRWVWFGSAAPSFIVGVINSVGFLSLQHQGVTHLAGSTALLGIAIAHGNPIDAFHLLAVAAAS